MPLHRAGDAVKGAILFHKREWPPLTPKRKVCIASERLEELRRLPNRVPAIFVAIRFDFLLSSLSLCLRFVTLTQFPSTTDFHCFVFACRGGLAGTRCNMEADGGRKLVRTSTSWAERQRIIEVGQIV